MVYQSALAEIMPWKKSPKAQVSTFVEMSVGHVGLDNAQRLE